MKIEEILGIFDKLTLAQTDKAIYMFLTDQQRADLENPPGLDCPRKSPRWTHYDVVLGLSEESLEECEAFTFGIDHPLTYADQKKFAGIIMDEVYQDGLEIKQINRWYSF